MMACVHIATAPSIVNSPYGFQHINHRRVKRNVAITIPRKPCLVTSSVEFHVSRNREHPAPRQREHPINTRVYLSRFTLTFFFRASSAANMNSDSARSDVTNVITTEFANLFS